MSLPGDSAVNGMLVVVKYIGTARIGFLKPQVLGNLELGCIFV